MSEVLLQQILNEMKGIKNEVVDLKNEVTGIKDEQKLTNERLTSIESKQEIIYKQTGTLTETQSKSLSLLEHLQSDVEFTYKKTAMNDLKINRIETTFIQKH